MPYLAVELDAKKQMGQVARAAGVGVGDVAWGLLELWEHVWSTEADVVSPVVLDGCIGEAPKLRPALVAFGFLEPIGDAFRVRGAERYLRVRRAQRDGGKLGRARSSSPVGRQGDPVGAKALDKVTSKVTLEDTSRSPPRSRQALTPSTEHRAPTTTTEVVVVAQQGEKQPADKESAPVVVTEPTTTPANWTALDFWRWAQARRQKAGLIAEKAPNHRELSAWYSNALLTLNGDTPRLQEALFRWGDDAYWQKATPPLPFQAFMSQWGKYIPKGEVNVA